MSIIFKIRLLAFAFRSSGHRQDAATVLDPCQSPPVRRKAWSGPAPACIKRARLAQAGRSPDILSRATRQKSPPGSRATLLNRLHIKSHLPAEVRSLRCSECDSSFDNTRALGYHLRMHNKERPFKCHICGKTFKEYYSLRMHTFVHTGEKPFECTLCEKKFRAMDALRQHRVTHTKVKPHMCKRCERKFSYRSGLHKHKCSKGN